MEKKTKYILIGSGAATTVSAIAGGMIYSAVNDLVKVAIDRQIPKRMKKQMRIYQAKIKMTNLHK